MTYRPESDYTIKKLSDILKDKSSRGNRTQTPFINFSETFLGPNVENLLKNGESDKYENGVLSIPVGMYKEPSAIGFFDSLHDFKNDFTDCQSVIKNQARGSQIFGYQKFGFSFLLHGGYPELVNKYNKLLIQDKYSYLNNKTRPLDQTSVENYFSIGNIYDTIKNANNGNMYILPNTRLENNQNIYNGLATLFENYIDPEMGNKIKLIVDFQMNLFDIIKETKGPDGNSPNFCILYTAETITDPALKKRTNKITDIFGTENMYIEQLGETGRKQLSSENINGKVDVMFKNIILSKPNDLENSTFSVTTTYTYTGLNNTTITDNIQMNTKANTIQNIQNFINKMINSRTATSTFNFFNESKDRTDFYNKFNTTIIKNDTNKYLANYSVYYARKRLGDTLQARICKIDKLGELTFAQVNKNVKQGKVYGSSNAFSIDNQKGFRPSNDAVLVTHDRMLFSYAVMNKVPTILDLNEHMIVYVPSPQSGGRKQGVNQNVSNANIFTPLDARGNRQLALINGPQVGDLNAQRFKKFKVKKDYTTNFTMNNTDHLIMNNTESIMLNVNDLIHFLILYTTHINEENMFETFFKELDKTKLINYSDNTNINDNVTIFYLYTGAYSNNRLIIGERNYINSQINKYENDTNNTELININVNGAQLVVNSNQGLVVNCNIINPNTFSLNVAQIKNILSNAPLFIELSDNSNSDLLNRTLMYVNKNNNVPLYESVLNMNHTDKINMLKDKNNLLINNVTIIYFLFDLLYSFELSLIGYQEAIETFYTKSDNSNGLNQMIEIQNYVPHNIELYVFLTLILNDLNAVTLQKYNYVFFEYYLLVLRPVCDIYSRFQDIKSYLFKENYENYENDTVVVDETYEYFKNILTQTKNITNEFIKDNYYKEETAQNNNLNYINQFHLKINGFIEMKNKFISVTKSINVINRVNATLPENLSNKRRRIITDQETGNETEMDVVSARDVTPLINHSNNNNFNNIKMAGYGGKKRTNKINMKKNNISKKRKICRLKTRYSNKNKARKIKARKNKTIKKR